MARLALLRGEPRYARAIRAFARNMLAQGERDKALDGILKDAGRNIAAKCLAYLDVTGGLTLPRLKALCASIGMVSPGRARALLIYLRYLGYAAPAGQRDGATLYKPTASFQRAWHAHTLAILKAVEMLEPAIARLLERFDDSATYESFVRCLSEGYLDGLNYIDSNSAYFRVFMHRYAGVQIMHTLLVANPGEDFPPEGPIPFCIADASRRFGVSEVHVRRLLRAGERQQLLRQPEPGTVVFEAAGRDAVEEVFATQMAVFLIASARATAARPHAVARHAHDAGIAANP